MGKLTVGATGKTSPEDPPPYPLKPLPTKPVLQTNIVVPEAEPGQPPARPRRCPKKCGTIALVTVCVVLVVAVVMLGVKLGKKHMMAGKHGCRDSGEEGHMARPRRCPKKCGTIALVTVCVVLVVALVILGVKLAKKHKMAGKHGCRDRGEEGNMAHPRRCPKKCGTITLVTVCVVLVVALVILGVKLAKKHKMAGKHGCRDRGEEGHMDKKARNCKYAWIAKCTVGFLMHSAAPAY
uniref:Uncharacterized protein n=1 Tax=Branchiostoma floridae TaxID=7739 RepID=C3Y6J1_BRAFL|eukprot:XP_002607941.1 hypothetical protein BRAFLDRAFT_74890 [Branchiostoma floridae]